MYFYFWEVLFWNSRENPKDKQLIQLSKEVQLISWNMLWFKSSNLTWKMCFFNLYVFKLSKFLKKEGCGSILLQLHDELVLKVRRKLFHDLTVISTFLFWIWGEKRSIASKYSTRGAYHGKCSWHFSTRRRCFGSFSRTNF